MSGCVVEWGPVFHKHQCVESNDAHVMHRCRCGEQRWDDRPFQGPIDPRAWYIE